MPEQQHRGPDNLPQIEIAAEVNKSSALLWTDDRIQPEIVLQAYS